MADDKRETPTRELRPTGARPSASPPGQSPRQRVTLIGSIMEAEGLLQKVWSLTSGRDMPKDVLDARTHLDHAMTFLRTGAMSLLGDLP